MADGTASLAQIRPSTGPWFETAHNVVEFANNDGSYDESAKLLGDHAQAASSAYAALSAAPHDELAMLTYTLARDGQGRGPEAMWMAWRTVTQHPNVALPQRLYARVPQKTHRYRDALIEVDEALRLSPANVDMLVLRGTILHDLGHIVESSAAYERALALDPGNAEAQNNLAVNRLRGKKFGHALRGFLGAAGRPDTREPGPAQYRCGSRDDPAPRHRPGGGGGHTFRIRRFAAR